MGSRWRGRSTSHILTNVLVYNKIFVEYSDVKEYPFVVGGIEICYCGDDAAVEVLYAGLVVTI